MPADKMLVRRRPVRDRILGVLLPDKVSFPFGEWNKYTVGLNKTFGMRQVKLTATQGEHVGTFLSCDSNGLYLSVKGRDTYVPFNSLVSLQAIDRT